MENEPVNPQQNEPVVEKNLFRNPSKKYKYSLLDFLTIISAIIAPAIGIVIWISQVESEMKLNIEHTVSEFDKIETIMNDRNEILEKAINETEEDVNEIENEIKEINKKIN